MKCPFCDKVIGADDEVINTVCDCGVGFLCLPGTREPTEKEKELISKLPNISEYAEKKRTKGR